jgi:hypothetical protein
MMEIDLEQARERANRELAQHRRPDLDLIFLDDRRHAETGRLEYALGGGGPIFVARSGDLVHMVWSGESWQTALDRYRESGSMRESP